MTASAPNYNNLPVDPIPGAAWIGTQAYVTARASAAARFALIRALGEEAVRALGSAEPAATLAWQVAAILPTWAEAPGVPRVVPFDFMSWTPHGWRRSSLRLVIDTGGLDGGMAGVVVALAGEARP